MRVGETIDGRAARIAKTEQFRSFIVGFAGGVVAGGADLADVRQERTVDAVEGGVAAGDEERQVRVGGDGGRRAGPDRANGEQMAEIGLMREADCVYITDAGKPIVDSKVMQRVLTYAKGFDTLLAHRPMDPWLAKGGAATGGEFAGRMGLPSISPMAERIMLERDVALLEATGGRLLVDQVTSAQALETLARAKQKGLRIHASVSINHLSFNELDIGDYRSFAKVTPPLRGEDDRQALIEALASGLIDIVVSAHAPAPAEDKRLPFDEAAPGAVGLETLLPALLSLYHEERLPLVDLIRAVTLAPAGLIGLQSGRIAPGAPADLVLCDLDAPLIIDAGKLLSKSKNSPFDGRRLQGQVLMTVVDGRVVHRAEG